MKKLILYFLILFCSKSFAQFPVNLTNLSSLTFKTYGNPSNPNLFMDTGKVLFSSKKAHIYWFDNQADGLYYKGGGLLGLGSTNGIQSSNVWISPVMISLVHSGSAVPQKILVPFSDNLNTQNISSIMVMDNDTIKTITIQQLVNLINQAQHPITQK